MPSRHSFEHRLAGYALAAGAALAAGPSTMGAIDYSPLDPDLVFTVGEGPQKFELDLDGDTLIDFDLAFSSSSSSFISLGGVHVDKEFHSLYVVGKSMNEVLNTNHYSYAKALHSGHSLGSGPTTSFTFGTIGLMGKQETRVYSTGMTNTWRIAGNFRGKQRKILALHFRIGGNWHYGWCRVSVDSASRQLTVHDYAYDTLAGHEIVPGAYLDPTLRGTVGCRIELKAVDVPGTIGGLFTAVPKVVGYYIDPVKGGKVKKTTLKGTLFPDKSTLILNVKKKVRLYDAKAFKAAYREGIRARYMMPSTSQGMLFDLNVTHEESGAPQTEPSAHLSLKPPYIQGFVPPLPGADPNKPIIAGKWFGIKRPKVWVEYRVPTKTGNIVKTVKLKVLKEFIYSDAKDKPNASCMDPDSGDSQITVQLPDAWPKGFDDVDPEHDLVIDNGVGLARLQLIP